MQAYREPTSWKDLVDVREVVRQMFLLLDAFDESPESNEVREHVLEGLERLAQKASGIRLFVTSREVNDVAESMKALRAIGVSIPARSVNADIQRYVSGQLSRDRRLSKLDTATKTLIETRILQKADAMYGALFKILGTLLMVLSTQVPMGVLPTAKTQEAQITQA